MGFLDSVTLAASWMGFVRGLFVVLFIVSCILLICIVLVQKGRGGGLSSAFGGMGGSSPFGTKTGDVFTWITVVLAGVFLAGALVLNIVYKPQRAETGYVAPAPAQGSPLPATPGAGGASELMRPATPAAETPTSQSGD